MFHWIRPTRLNKSDVAHRVVVDSRTLVWQRIAPRAGLPTSLREAQGYIRSRAKSVVRARLAAMAVATGRLSATHEQQIVALALAALTEHFTSLLLHAQPARTSVRRAA